MNIDFELISEIDWARLAAYIDGEGYLGVTKVISRESLLGHRYRVALTITNTNYLLMDWLVQTFGFKVVEYDYQEVRKPQYTAYASLSLVRCILPKVERYLILKQEQTALVLEFINSKATAGSNGVEVLQVVEDERARIYMALKELNQRGAPKSWS